MATIADSFDPLKRPNSFGDAAAAAQNNMGAVRQMPGGNAIPGMVASEVSPVPQIANPNVGPAGSPEAQAFRARTAAPVAGNAFGDAAAAANNPSIQQRATGALRDGFDQMRGVGRSMGPIQPVSALRQGFNVAGRVAGPAIGLAVEGGQVAKVAQDPNATGVDVATQAAQGVGRLGSAGAGALLGAKGGAALGAFGGPVGSAVGGVIGGAAGGIAGYFGADKAIDIGRRAAGTDPVAPADRLPAELPAAAAVPGAGAAAAATPVDPSMQITGPAPSPMRRIGNSFSDGTDQAGDMPSTMRAALGVRNSGVGMVSAAGVTPADRLGQIERDTAFQKDKQTWTRPSDATPGMTSINGDYANRNQEFNAQADLRNATNRTRTDRRGNVVMDPSAEVIAAGIKDRARSRDSAAKNATDSGIARSNDATARADIASRADSTRYTADSNVRASSMKNAYELQTKLGDRMAQAEALRQAGGDPARAAQILAGSGRDPSTLTGLANAEQTRAASTQSVQAKAIGNTRDGLTAFNPDGTENKALSAAAYSAVNKILPGLSNMNEAARERAMPTATALADIFSKTAGGNQMGWDKVNPFQPKGAPLDSLPSFKGGKLNQAGIDGLVTPGSAMGDYYLTTKDGKHVPLGKLSEKQLELIDGNIKTGKWN